MQPLTQAVKGKAKQLKFSVVGIASTNPALEAESCLQTLKNKGIRIPFTTDAIARRTKPKLLWPKAKALVLVGWPYEVPTRGPTAKGSLKGYLAAGSSGRDYHDLVRDKLASLKNFIEKRAGPDTTEIFVDTSPLLERAFAARAGLGVWGENSFIMEPQLASTFFLGGLATSLPLVPDTPLTATCLQCGRCRRACPTGALAEPYRLNYRRCLSYWTQAREIMPEKLRPLLGNRIYGCDSCLRACPLIKKAPQEGVTVDLIKFLFLTEAEFQDQYGTSSIAWRGRTVLQRNAALAVGNSGRKEAIPALIKTLGDKRASIRAAAAWSLGQYEGEESKLALRTQQRHEREPLVRAEIEASLQRICT